MPRMSRSEALEIFQRAKVDPAANFFSLRSSEVHDLLIEANARHYRAPKNAPGSRSRMFHGYLQRALKRED